MSPLGISVVIFILFSTGIYLLLRPSIFRIVLGTIFLGNALNLFILSSQKIAIGSSPILTSVLSSVQVPPDALPQALILTAIVISFGIMLIVLAVGSYASEENSKWDQEEGSSE